MPDFIPSEAQELYRKRLERQRQQDQAALGNNVTAPAPVVTPEGAVNTPSIPVTIPASERKYITGTPENQQYQQDQQKDAGAFKSIAMGVGKVYTNAIESWHETNAYKKYAYNKAEVLEEAKKISKATGIPENAILASSENLDNARDIYNFGKKQTDLTDGEDFDINKVFEKYPEVRKILNTNGDTDAAILLSHFNDVKEIRNIFDAVSIGLRRASLNRERDYEIGSREYLGQATEEDRKRLAEIDAELQTLPEMPGLLEDPWINIVGGTAEQLPRQLYGIRQGAIRGLEGALGVTLAGRAGQALATARLPRFMSPIQAVGTIASTYATDEAASKAFGTGMRLGIAEDMFWETVGRDYMEYKDKKDVNGNQWLTDDQCRMYATVAAALETGIEFANMNIILNALGGIRGAGKAAILDVIKGAKDTASLQAGLRTILKEVGEITISESLEEGAQEISNDVIHNVAIRNNPNGEEQPYSAGEIAEHALTATGQALGPSFGFGLMAAAGGTSRIVRRTVRQTMLRDEFYEGQSRNANGKNMLAQLREKIKDSKLFKSDPDLGTELIKNNLEKTDLQTVYLDAELLSDTESGQAVLNTIVNNGIYTAEEIDQKVADGENITIPTEVYAQLDMSDDMFVVAQECTSFSGADDSLARIKKHGIDLYDRISAIQSREDTRAIEALERWSNDNLETDEEKELARNILLTSEDPFREIADRRRAINENIKNRFTPITDVLKKGTANDTWYQELQDDLGHKPYNADFDNVAYNILTGEGKDYGLSALAYEDAVGQDDIKAQEKAEIDGLRRDLNNLNNLEEKFRNTDMEQVRISANLTPDAYEVYKDAEAKLMKHPAQDVREAARAGAILYAHHADVIAKARQEAGDTNYTAKDYAANKPIVVNAAYDPNLAVVGYNQSAFHGSADEFTEFDLGYAGTGEGGAAHGWGIYTAEQLNTAKKYYNMAKGHITALFRGERLVPSDKRYQALRYTIVNLGYRDKISKKEVNARIKQNMEDDGGLIEDRWERIRDLEQLKEEYKNLPPQEVYSRAEDKIRIWGFKRYVDNLVSRGMSEQEAIGQQIDKTITDMEENIRELQDEYRTLKGLYNNKDLKLERGVDRGMLLKVEIPDADVMLNEDKSFAEQSPNIQKALDKAIDDIPEENLRNWNTDRQSFKESLHGETTGREIYGTIANCLGSPKEASLLLNKNGIKGISYNGRQDGRCYVVFDDKAVNIIERYNQEAEQNDKDWIAEANRLEKQGASREEILNQTGWFRNDKGKWSTVRGQIVINGADKTINIFKTGNWSTFVHEMGHLNLSDLKELAEMENAPKWAVRDWNSVKEWIGWREGQEGFTVAQQEKFAKAFEAYLREGNAPTEALLSPFRRFKNWLTDIYKSLINLVEPSDEIRRVMDRMLATQQEIDDYTAQQEWKSFEAGGGMKYLDGTSEETLRNIIQTAKDEAYEKTVKHLMGENREEYQRGRQEYLDSERAKITAELEKQPEFAISEFMNQFPDANLEKTVAELTNNQMTVEEYKERIAAEGGSLDAAIRQRMSEIEADIKDPTDEELKTEAERAVNTSRGLALQKGFELAALIEQDKEVKRLDRQTKRKNTPRTESQKQQKNEILHNLRVTRDAAEGYRQSIFRAARERMETMSIKDATDEAKWRNMSMRYQAECFNNMAKREWTRAVEAKQAELYYYMLAGMAQQNKIQTEKIATALTKRSEVMRKNNNVSVNERYAYNHFLYVFGLTQKDAQSMPDYSFTNLMYDMDANLENSFIDEDGNLDLPDFVLNAATAQQQRRDGYKDLTMNEFKGLQNLMNSIYKAGRQNKDLKTLTRSDGTRVTQEQGLSEIRTEADSRMADIANADPTGAQKQGWTNEFCRTVSNYFLHQKKPEVVLRQLGEKAVEYIYMPLKRAADMEMRLANGENGYVLRFKKILSNYTAKEFKDMENKKIYQLGSSKITKEQLLCVALNWGTELNKKRIMDGFNLTENEVRTVLKNLDERDWNVVREIWKLVNSYWEDTKRVEASVTGVVLEKQEATKFTIVGNDGQVHQLDGGYYPIKYDRRDNLTLGERADEQELKVTRGGLTQLGMRKGFTKSRVEGRVDAKVLLDLNVVTSSLIDVTHNIAYREAIRDVNRLVRSREFTDLVQRKFGADTARMLRKWVLDSWSPAPKANDPISKMSRKFRTNATSATLGFRTMTALLNAGNVPPMMSYLRESESRRTGENKSLGYGVMRGLIAFKDYYGNITEMPNKRRMIMEKSIFMRDRAETMDRDMKAVLTEGKYGAITKNAFRCIEETDLMVGLPMWWAEYNSELAYGIQQGLSFAEADRAAVEAGDASVRRTIASGQQIDLSAIQRGTEMEKNFTMYMSYMNTVLNALMWKYSESKRIRYQGGSMLKSLAPIADGMLLWIAGNAFLNGGVRWFFNGRDDDGDLEGFLKAWLLESVGVGTGGLTYFKDIIDFVVRRSVGEKVYSSKGIPLEQVEAQAEQVVNDIVNEKYLNAGRNILRLSNYATGLSQSFTDAIITTIEWWDEDFDSDVADYLRAVIMDRRLKR